jgi:hypothetical protein
MTCQLLNKMAIISLWSQAVKLCMEMFIKTSIQFQWNIFICFLSAENTVMLESFRLYFANVFSTCTGEKYVQKQITKWQYR